MSQPVYECRNRITPRVVLVTLGCLVFTALGIWMVRSPGYDPSSIVAHPVPWGWACIVFFGGGGVFFLAATLTTLGKVAIGIDAGGVFLGGMPLRYERTSGRFAWESIARIVLFRIQRSPHIGLQGTGEPLELPGAGSNLRRRVNNHIVGLGQDVANTCRPLVSVPINVDELIHAVAQVAPHVQVLDLR